MIIKDCGVHYDTIYYRLVIMTPGFSEKPWLQTSPSVGVETEHMLPECSKKLQDKT